MDRLSKGIVQKLLSDAPLTSVFLAEFFNVSEKTVRNRIKEMEEELTENGALIVSRRGSGYYLNVIDHEVFDEWFETSDNNSIPVLPKERVLYLIKTFLFSDEYQLIDDLADSLCVSRNTITGDLKEVEHHFSKFGLEFERRPNYGMKIKGHEKNIRSCLADLIKLDRSVYAKEYKQCYKKCECLINKVIIDNNISATIEHYHEIIEYFTVSVIRFNEGHKVILEDKQKKDLNEELFYLFESVGNDIFNLAESTLNITLSLDEVLLCCLKIASMTNLKNYGINSLFDYKIDSLNIEMLKEVKDVLKIDLLNNFELRAALNQHLFPLDLRLTFGIQIENPALEMVQHKYSFAYNVATCASSVLAKHYNCVITADEIGFIAVIFVVALEKSRKKKRPKNVIIVCLSGQSSSRLFVHAYKEIFGEYLGEVYQCGYTELNNFDFEKHKIDYCFTTVDGLKFDIPVPVFHISLFPDDDEIKKYRRLLKKETKKFFLGNYYNENLFISNLDAATKEEAILKITEHIRKFYAIPDDFESFVLEREKYGITSFGTGVALPHPKTICTDRNIVVVAVLNKPVLWGNDEVQIIILTSLSNNFNEESDEFIETTSEFMMDIEKINYLAEHPDFNIFMDLLCS